MAKLSLKESLANGPHQTLHRLTGTWKGNTKTWFTPGAAPSDESVWEGTIRPLLDGRFVIHEYKGRLKDDEFQGMAIYGYNLSKKTYECSWIDTFHMGTGIMAAEGPAGEKGFGVLGYYFVGADHPDWGWRTEFEIIDDNTIVITAYNISPYGQEAKALETRYTRQQ